MPGPPAGAWDDGPVSVPQYPRPDQSGKPGPGSWEQPGLIPLRPMTVVEVLGVGWRILKHNLLPLGGAAVLVAALSTTVTLSSLALTGSLQTFAEAGWLDDLLTGKSTGLPGGIVLASVLGLLVTSAGAPVVAGLATAYAGAGALGKNGAGAVAERLRGRWPVLLGVAATVGAVVGIGLMLLFVPGVFAYLILALAAPIVVMERGAVGASLRRSAALTRGHRGRILGAVAVTMISGVLAGAVVSAVIGGVVGQTGSVGVLMLSEFVSVVVGGVAAGWTGAVVAVLYIDIRIRAEHLDQALRYAAAADPGRISPTIQPGF